MLLLPSGTLARVLVNGALVVMLGEWVTGWVVTHAAAGPVARGRRTAAAAWALLLAGCVMHCAEHLSDLELGWNAAGLHALVLETAWGHAWLALTSCAAVALLFVALTDKRWVRGSLAVVAAVLVGGLGHAAADERWPLFARVVDAVHVLAMGAWAGGLAGVAWWARGVADDASVRGWRTFSRVALVAAPLVICTGLGATALRVQDPSAFLTSSWGQWLMAKSALVVAALGLGWRHKRALARDAAPAEGSLKLELATMVLVVLATGALTGSPPPGE